MWRMTTLMISDFVEDSLGKIIAVLASGIAVIVTTPPHCVLYEAGNPPITTSGMQLPYQEAKASQEAELSAANLKWSSVLTDTFIDLRLRKIVRQTLNPENPDPKPQAAWSLGVLSLSPPGLQRRRPASSQRPCLSSGHSKQPAIFPFPTNATPYIKSSPHTCFWLGTMPW